MALKQQLDEIDGKLRLLNFTTKKTNDEEVGIRQKGQITKIILAISDLKQQIEEKKFIEGDSEENVAAWGESIEENIALADEKVKQLNEYIQRLKADERQKESALENENKRLLDEGNYARQQAFEKHERDKQLAFEQELFNKKLQYQKEIKEVQAGKNSSTKLPKLVITPFNGSYHDWLRFWGQFSAGIELADIPDVMKFSYLKELVEPKIRTCIDGLPFTTEGYKSAKKILEEKYGNTSEIVNSYVEEIVNLPTITSTRPEKIHPFYEKLVYCVQSLETLGKLQEVNGYVRLTLNKVPGIRGDLVRTEPKWKDWTFTDLVKALFAWTERNPIEAKTSNERKDASRAYQTRQIDQKSRVCVYCDSKNHKSIACDSVTTCEARRKLLSDKKLCFNCTGGSHRASECRSKQTCQNCNRRHHTSICELAKTILTAAYQPSDHKVIYPVVLVEVDGTKCRALLDTGSGSSYASAKLVEQLNKKPSESKVTRVEMLMGSATRRVEIFNVNISSTESNFNMETKLTKVEKPCLMELPNPHYDSLIKKYPHLGGVKMIDDDQKDQLPIHVVLGACDYARIKTKCAQRVGSPGDPVAEKTSFGWTMMSPRVESDSNKMLLTQTSTGDYENLCRLDVLGLEDLPENDQDIVYAEFKEQLRRDPAGWYETGLPWKGNHPPLPSNKQGSVRRLESLMRKLNRSSITEKYDQIIQEQIQEDIVQSAPEKPNGHEFYIPHKPVIRENADSTKLRIVYDASAKESAEAPSLNDCLHTGPSLQNKLWSVLVRGRFHPVAVSGDLQKAFLQVRIKVEDRDALRFHWKPNSQAEIQTLRFTRALFGLAPSPFLLGGVIEYHLQSWEDRKPDTVAEIKKSLYVDDLISGSTTVEKAKELRDGAIEIFEDAKFTLHKWNSNEDGLQPKEVNAQSDESTYAKQQLGVKANESKILGLPWDKAKDTLKVVYPQEYGDVTKRGILTSLAKIYDPLGLVSPTTLIGKLVYRDVCDLKSAWDAPIPSQPNIRWKKWFDGLPNDVQFPRSIVRHQETIESVDLHSFGDASGNGVAATVYAVVNQQSGSSQGLVTAKSRLAKRNTTIPRLELTSAHMATNLLNNVKNALSGFPINELHAWLDSTVALYWIQNGGDYKQFVANRVRKIQVYNEIVWHHVPTGDNPADLGSRGGSVTNHNLWWNGPEWLANREEWPPEIVIKSSPGSKAETKMTKEVINAAVERVDDQFDDLLKKHNLWKVLRIGAWINRFLLNCKAKPRDRQLGPLRASEIKIVKKWWIKRVQNEAKNQPVFAKESLELNLQVNDEHILECRGRIQGVYPVYLPDNHTFTEKVVEDSHLQTLHGGVTLTMTHVRNSYWIPRLRRLVKRIRKSCFGCKRAQAKAYSVPPPGILPTTRTEGKNAFEVIGVDFAGPLKYCTARKTFKKSYLILYTCSLTRNLVPRVFALGELNTLVWSGHVTRGFCVKWRLVY